MSIDAAIELASSKLSREAMEGDKASGCGGLVLLNCFVSPYGNRVRIALKRKGLAYEEKPENLAAKSALLLSSNPVHAKVPVLLVGGKPVCESLVILQFIDEAFAGAGEPLLPAAPCARAHARFWASYVDTKVRLRRSTDRPVTAPSSPFDLI